MENELDMLLDEYDELTEDLYFCKVDLTKRRKLLRRRCNIRKRIEKGMTKEKSLSKKEQKIRNQTWTIKFFYQKGGVYDRIL